MNLIMRRRCFFKINPIKEMNHKILTNERTALHCFAVITALSLSLMIKEICGRTGITYELMIKYIFGLKRSKMPFTFFVHTPNVEPIASNAPQIELRFCVFDGYNSAFSCSPGDTMISETCPIGELSLVISIFHGMDYLLKKLHPFTNII